MVKFEKGYFTRPLIERGYGGFCYRARFRETHVSVLMSNSYAYNCVVFVGYYQNNLNLWKADISSLESFEGSKRERYQAVQELIRKQIPEEKEKWLIQIYLERRSQHEPLATFKCKRMGGEKGETKISLKERNESAESTVVLEALFETKVEQIVHTLSTY